MFCLDEPDRHPVFRAANDRTLAFAERSDGRLIPFVRLDLTSRRSRRRRAASTPGPAGSSCTRGRRSSRRPTSGSRPVFELAAERRVPILIHGGRGLPPIADGLAGARRRLPGRDADHRARGDRRPRELARRMAGRKGVLFDTSTWSPVDLLDFYRQVPPEQVRLRERLSRTASSPRSLLIALKTARLAGYDDDQLRGDARRHGERARRRRASCRSRRRRSAADSFTQPMQLARIHQYLSMATPLLWIAPARHDRRARPGDQRLRRAQRPRRRRSTASTSC